MGELLAEEVVRANGRVTPVPSGPEGIDWRSDVITFRDRWDNAATMEVGLTTVLINGAVTNRRRCRASRCIGCSAPGRNALRCPCRCSMATHSAPAGPGPGIFPTFDWRRTAATAPTPARESRLAPGNASWSGISINLYDMQKKWLPQPRKAVGKLEGEKPEVRSWSHTGPSGTGWHTRQRWHLT